MPSKQDTQGSNLHHHRHQVWWHSCYPSPKGKWRQEAQKSGSSLRVEFEGSLGYLDSKRERERKKGGEDKNKGTHCFGHPVPNAQGHSYSPVSSWQSRLAWISL